MYRGKTAYIALSISAGTLMQLYSLKGHLVSMSFQLRKITVELCLDIFPHSCLHLSSGEEKEISWQYFSQQTSCILPAVKCQECLTF